MLEHSGTPVYLTEVSAIAHSAPYGRRLIARHYGRTIESAIAYACLSQVRIDSPVGRIDVRTCKNFRELLLSGIQMVVHAVLH